MGRFRRRRHRRQCRPERRSTRYRIGMDQRRVPAGFDVRGSVPEPPDRERPQGQRSLARHSGPNRGREQLAEVLEQPHLPLVRRDRGPGPGALRRPAGILRPAQDHRPDAFGRAQGRCALHIRHGGVDRAVAVRGVRRLRRGLDDHCRQAPAGSTRRLHGPGHAGIRGGCEAGRADRQHRRDRFRQRGRASSESTAPWSRIRPARPMCSNSAMPAPKRPARWR